MRYLLLLLFFLPTLVSAQHWVSTWTTAQQTVEQNNLPPSPGLSGNSLRQIVQVSIGGPTLRLKLSNEFSNGTTQIRAVEIAKATTGGSSSDVQEGTTVSLTFGGQPGVVMAAGGMATSDPIDFPLSPRDNVAITIHYGTCSNTNVTGHPGSRTASYLAAGNTTSFASAKVTEHWYNICGIDVDAPEGSRAVAVLGNSITDGRGSTTNQQDRWTDQLSRAMLLNEATADVAVLNLGIGGNCVIGGGLGPSASSRYMRDLFGQEGVKYVVLFEGINDLGYCGNGVETAQRIIAVYRNIIDEAHRRGIWVYGATITPFKGNSYYSADHEKGRQYFNDWARSCQDVDACIDFDLIVRSEADPLQLRADFLYQDDYLHPNAQGYLTMGQSVDLQLFTRTDAPEYTDPRAGKEFIYLEAEAMTDPASTAYTIESDASTSGGQYLRTAVNNANLPSDPRCYLQATFTTTQPGPYYLFCRVNCPSYDDDSYYVRIDQSDYARVNGLFTGGQWQWLDWGSMAESALPLGTLAPGQHTISIASREDGACIDRICICNYPEAPTGLGEPAPAEPVAISTLPADAHAAAPALYNLAGQRLQAVPARGLCLQRGKKVYVH